MKLLLRSILFFSIASFAPLAFGQNTIWNNQGGDNTFETATNWSNGVPNSSLSTYIFPGATSNTSNPDTYFPGGQTAIVITAAASHTANTIYIAAGFATNAVGTVTMTFAPTTTLTVSTGVTVSNETLNFSGNLTELAGTIDVAGESFYVPGPSTMNFTNGTLDASSAATTLSVGSAGFMGTFAQTGASTVLVNQLNIGTTGGTGIYNISGTGNNLTLSANGLVQLGNGTFTQDDGTSTVDLSSTGSSIDMGLTSGDMATYNLQAGTLKMTDTYLGFNTGSTGTINESGGTFISSGVFDIGTVGGGTGNFNLSGGSADFQNGFLLGDAVGSTFTQSGGSTLTAEGAVMIGTAGIGTYNLQGGTATFNAGVVVGATGSINQTGGTFTIPTGQTLDLSAAGSSYTLGGTGILQVANTGLVGTTGEGTLNFAGGTLQVTSAGAFTDALDGTLTKTSTIDAATTPGVTSVTMAGNLSGAGGITFAGSAGTTFQFAGTNTYTGPTTITSGILNANQADISNAVAQTFSSALNIGPTGVLNLTLNAGGFAYAGAIGGTGAFNINFNTAGDPFVVLNTSSFTGPITLGANGTPGTLQVYSGSYGNIGDNGTASGVQIGGAPLATFPGGAVIPATGIVIFGNNTYTGMTTITSGFTLDADSLGGSVTNNGTLGLAPGSAVGSTLNINGALSSTGANAVLAIRANGTGATPLADLILASGVVTIDSASTITVTGTGNISTPIPIVTGTSGLTVAPGLLPNTSTSLLFHPTLSVVGNSIDLTAVQNPASSFATTSNQAAAGAPIDQIIANPGLLNPTQQASFDILLQGLNNLATPAQVAAALEQLTPESLQYARMISFENSNLLAVRMNGVDADLRGGYGGLDTSAMSIVAPGFNSGLGRSLGSLMAYNDPAFHQAAPNGVNYYPGGESDNSTSSSSSHSSSSESDSTPSWNSSSQVISDNPNPYLATQHPSGPETPAFSEFIGGDVILADLNQNQNTSNSPSSKASYTAGDATAGVSFRMNSHLAAGVLFDYNHTDAKTDSSGSKTSVDSYSPGLFATYFDHGFYVNGLFSFGYNNYSNSRNISFLGETANSNPSGQQYVGDLDFGYDFHPNKQWVVGPTLGVTYTHLDIDSFTETGAPGADLAVNSQSADSVRSRLGGHVVFQTNTGDVLLQPNLTAMWQHEYLDNSSGITSSYNDFSSSPFTIETAAPSRDSALIGCGLTATLNNSMALYISYIADVGADDYFAQSVVGGFKTRF